MSVKPKALLVVAHYYKPEQVGIYSSTAEGLANLRRSSIEVVLHKWRALFGQTRSLNWNLGVFDQQEGEIGQLDIVILTHQNNHLLDAEVLRKFGAEQCPVDFENPRMLPFFAHEVIRSRVQFYDWFVYTEDDIVPHDVGLFRKQEYFQKVFGSNRLLQPNRFEINFVNKGPKTYCDGDLPPEMVSKIWQYREEARPVLIMNSEIGVIRFERARNPHSGFFMLTSEQVSYWISQPHFYDLDCSFVTPLESAASLSLLKTFSLYKAANPTDWFFEVEHLDAKFSSLAWSERKRV